MRPILRFTGLILSCLFLFSACSKEGSTKEPEGNENGNGNGNGNNIRNCNNSILKLKKCQSLSDPGQYIEVAWNSDKSIQSIKMNTFQSKHLTAQYVHGRDGKIKEAILLDHANNNTVYDTAVFHYNAANKVDSMYLRNSHHFDIALGYSSNSKLVRYTRYSAGAVLFYWDIKTDNQDNITNAVCYYEDGAGGFRKESTYTWTRDDKKNPFSGLAPYMMYLDDDFNIFWYWGANNFVDQRYQDHTGTGIDLTSGHKFKYNNSCYPGSSQSTISGQVFSTDPDFSFIYY